MVVIHIDKIQPIQCPAGHRRDCVNKRTCVFRHIGEAVGDALRPFSFVTDGKSDNSNGSPVICLGGRFKYMSQLQLPMDYLCRTHQTNPISAPGKESDTKKERDGRNSHGRLFLTINIRP